MLLPSAVQLVEPMSGRLRILHQQRDPMGLCSFFVFSSLFQLCLCVKNTFPCMQRAIYALMMSKPGRVFQISPLLIILLFMYDSEPCKSLVASQLCCQSSNEPCYIGTLGST